MVRIENTEKKKFYPLQFQNKFDVERKKKSIHFMLKGCIF